MMTLWISVHLSMFRPRKMPKENGNVNMIDAKLCVLVCAHFSPRALTLNALPERRKDNIEDFYVYRTK